MIYRIYYEGKRKFALPIKNREELMALRNSQQNLDNLSKARQGDVKAKSDLLQLAYNIGHVNGLIAGCKSIGSFFFHDVDCYDNEHSESIKKLVLEKKDEIGLRMLERSASGGWHLVCERRPGTTILENQVHVATILKVEMDTGAKDLQRVVFSTSGSEEDLPFLDDCLFTEPMSVEECEAEYERLRERQRRGEEEVPAGAKKSNKHYRPWEDFEVTEQRNHESTKSVSPASFPTHYHGIPFTDIIRKYWEVNNRGFEPTRGDRDTLTYQLACDLRHICGRSFEWLDQVIPCYDGFPLEEKRAKIRSALASEFNGFPQRLRNTLSACAGSMDNGKWIMDNEENTADDEQLSIFNCQLSIKRMPQGIKDSIDAVGPQLTMPVVTAICPCIGMLATGVTLDVHGQKRGLNLISYIAGDFASGKGGIDPVVEAWMSEVVALDKMYQMQEAEWRAKKRAAKNKKEQPEEPKLPVRCLTLNNTVANLAERLANTEGKHAFSFTPEADTVAQKWKSTMSDFSIMLRQSYDGTKYEREARSADAVNVHIDKLLWNVTMCGTPDALYRVVSNYTDGFQSRIAIARTPDNTFAPLEEKPYVLTDRQRERIQQIAHLLPLMFGEVVLPKLEAKGREWVERVRVETMKNDDRIRARQRFRVCVTAQRMTTCLMLCKVCETLIQKHGLSGAESQLKQRPGLWKEMLLKAQTPTMLAAYDVIADSLLENALYFFRDRIENAFQSRDYAGYVSGERQKRGKNDSIFERLDPQFTFAQAMQHSVAVKGAGVNQNTVRQMLKNWRKQGLVVLEENGNYRKL
ncbi:MAG: DUF3987 domain-containing protein [Prevotella sp.]|nr:DUF3987 domain-containing protein [Prevotella sp.]